MMCVAAGTTSDLVLTNSPADLDQEAGGSPGAAGDECDLGVVV